jgi:hypothetical protein
MGGTKFARAGMAGTSALAGIDGRESARAVF